MTTPPRVRAVQNRIRSKRFSCQLEAGIEATMLMAGCAARFFSAVSVITWACDSLMLVDGRVWMIIAPVEPVIFQRGEAVEAFAL